MVMLAVSSNPVYSEESEVVDELDLDSLESIPLDTKCGNIKTVCYNCLCAGVFKKYYNYQHCFIKNSHHMIIIICRYSHV